MSLLRTIPLGCLCLLLCVATFGLGLIGGCCGLCGLWSAGCPPIDRAAVIGVWEAKYDLQELIRFYCPSSGGVETLVLRADGTYQQVYQDRTKRYTYTSPWNEWRLERRERGWIIHLVDGRLYPLGIEGAEKLANGQLVITSNNDGRGHRLELDGSEVILHVSCDPGAPGGLILEYPPVCDPDGFALLEFHRVPEPEAATDTMP